MTDPITIRTALDLRPEDAIRAFRQRDELAVSYGWRDWAPEEHARGFTIANVFKLDLLVEAGGSLDAALKEGKTEQMWREGLSAELQAFGKRRLQTIFRTNMRVSRAAGQWARIQALKDARPFLRYSAVLDSRTRPLHARWHAIIRPVDDPIWQTIFPPNGFNCRCQVQQLSQRDLDRRGWVVTPDADLPQLDPIGETLMGGRIRPVIKGVDEGWDYNPGAQSFAGLVARAAEVLAKAEAAGLNLAAAEVRDAIVAELEQVLGRTLALALLAQLAPAAVQIEAAARRGKKGGKQARGSSGVSADTRAKLSKAASLRKRDGQGRFDDEPGTPRGPADRGEIRRLARKALANRSFKDRLVLREASDLSSAPDLPPKLATYRRSIDADHVRHVDDGHGRQSAEVAAGKEHPVRRRDFERYEDIARSATSRSIEVKAGTADRLLSQGVFEGRSFVLIEEIQTQRRRLGFKTLRFPK